MEHRTARVAALQLVLHLQSLEQVVRVAGGQLGAVRIVTVAGCAALDDIREALLVLAGKAVRGSFSRGCLQVVEVTGGLLVAADAFTHEVEHFLSKGNTLRLGGVHRVIGEVTQHFIHAVKTDGGEVVTQVRQVALGVGVQPAVIQGVDEYALLLQCILSQVHQLTQLAVQQVLVALVQVAQACQVNRHHADGTGHFSRTEQTTTALEQFAQIQLQAAAHGAHGIRLVGLFVNHLVTVLIVLVLGTHKVLEVGGTNLGGILKQQRHVLSVPVEILCDIHGRNREGEGLPRAVTLGKHFIECLLDNHHFLLEVLVGQIRQTLHTAFLGNGKELLILKAFKDVLVAGHRGLLAQVARNRPVNRHVGEGALTPAARYVQIVHKPAQRLLHGSIRKLVLEEIGGKVGIKRAECLCTGPFALQNAQEVGHLPQSLAEMLGRAAVHAATHTIEPLIQQGAQAPAGAVTSEAVKVVNVVVTIAVGGTFLRGIHLVEPVIGNHLTSRVIHQTGIGVGRIGIGLDAPVRIANVLLNRLLTIHPGITLVQTGNLLTLQLVQETVLDEITSRIVSAGTHEFLLNAVLHHFHWQVFLVLQFIQHVCVDKRIILLL